MHRATVSLFKNTACGNRSYRILKDCYLVNIFYTLSPTGDIRKASLKMVSSIAEFIENGTERQFCEVYRQYQRALKIKASSKTKDGDKLLNLDDWFQNKLPDLISNRKELHLKHNELVELMKWKLSRGKMRPRLIEFVTSNSEELVESVTNKGIKLAQKNSIKEAIEVISKLKGVGPATASAVLAAAVPEKCGFFADEVAYACLGSSSLKYNLNEYLSLNKELVICCNRLNSESDSNENWTPHMIELTIWAIHFLSKDNKEFFSSLDKKRKIDDE